MSFRKELRHQFAAESESQSVGHMRFYAAGLNVLGGLFGAALLLPMIDAELSWAAAPGSALLIAGGVIGVTAQMTREVITGRRRLRRAWACTVLGIVNISVVAVSTP